MIFYHLEKFHNQTINLSEEISKRIIKRKWDITRSVIYQHFLTNTVEEKKRNQKTLK